MSDHKEELQKVISELEGKIATDRLGFDNSKNYLDGIDMDASSMSFREQIGILCEKDNVVHYMQMFVKHGDIAYSEIYSPNIPLPKVHADTTTAHPIMNVIKPSNDPDSWVSGPIVEKLLINVGVHTGYVDFSTGTYTPLDQYGRVFFATLVETEKGKEETVRQLTRLTRAVEDDPRVNDGALAMGIYVAFGLYTLNVHGSLFKVAPWKAIGLVIKSPEGIADSGPSFADIEEASDPTTYYKDEIEPGPLRYRDHGGYF